MATHSGVKAHSCYLCGAKFARNFYVKVSLKGEHILRFKPHMVLAHDCRFLTTKVEYCILFRSVISRLYTKESCRRDDLGFEQRDVVREFL